MEYLCVHTYLHTQHVDVPSPKVRLRRRSFWWQGLEMSLRCCLTGPVTNQERSRHDRWVIVGFPGFQKDAPFEDAVETSILDPPPLRRAGLLERPEEPRRARSGRHRSMRIGVICRDYRGSHDDYIEQGENRVCSARRWSHRCTREGGWRGSSPACPGIDAALVHC